jgi:hypothetical protein
MYGVEEVRAEKRNEYHRSGKTSIDRIQTSPDCGGLHCDIGAEKGFALPWQCYRPVLPSEMYS